MGAASHLRLPPQAVAPLLTTTVSTAILLRSGHCAAPQQEAVDPQYAVYEGLYYVQVAFDPLTGRPLVGIAPEEQRRKQQYDQVQRELAEQVRR